MTAPVLTQQHKTNLHGTLSCYDRIILKLAVDAAR
jgi:hypothetical protein